MNAECPHCSSAAAYLAGELPPGELSTFEAHLASCLECRQAVDSTRDLLDRLRAVPRIESARDLAPDILARIREETASRHYSDSLPSFRRFPHPWPRVAAIAALLTLCAGAAFVAHLREQSADLSTAGASSLAGVTGTEANAVGITRALAWFCQTQEPDGSWNAEKWGGNPRFEIALTALPTLSLLSADALTPQSERAVAAATRWLQGQQAEDGAFGPEFQGASYNQSIATLALLYAYQRQPDPALKRSLDAALQAILTRQTADGGWGYLHTPYADRSITEWHIEGLELASKLGWEVGRAAPHSRPHLARRPPQFTPRRRGARRFAKRLVIIVDAIVLIFIPIRLQFLLVCRGFQNGFLPSLFPHGRSPARA